MTTKERLRHQILRVSMLIMLLWLLTAVGSIITDAQDTERQSEKISVFVDRNSVKEGESFRLIIQAVPPYALLPEPEITVPKQLHLKPIKSDTPSQKMEYDITGVKAGKYNIQARIKYKTDTAQDAPSNTIIREIKNIEVKKDDNSDWSKFAFTMLGGIIAGVIGFAAGIGKTIFDGWWEGRKKKKWIFGTLLNRLQIIQQRVNARNPSEYETLMKEFFEGEYYSALQKLSPKDQNLSEEMLFIHRLLIRYEKNRIMCDTEELLDRLKNVVEALR